MDNQQSTKLQN